MKRLRVLTWHVHGNYLYYLSQTPCEFFIPVKAGNPSGYASVRGGLPFGDNVHEVAADEVSQLDLDVVLYQSRMHYEVDRLTLLSTRQLALPQVYLEHDPPQEHPTNTRHWFQEPDGLLIHCTHFNALMWDSGLTPTRVVEHGVKPLQAVRASLAKPRGVAVVNNLERRGRRLGYDVFQKVASEVPIDLIGMNSSECGGLGEVRNDRLAQTVGEYRFFFNPIRYTSLGLSIIEAMMTGLPVVGLATTELVTVIESGKSGFLATDLHALIDAMRRLIQDPAEAARMGSAARAVAFERFGIERFCSDWLNIFHQAIDGDRRDAPPTDAGRHAEDAPGAQRWQSGGQPQPAPARPARFLSST